MTKKQVSKKQVSNKLRSMKFIVLSAYEKCKVMDRLAALGYHHHPSNLPQSDGPYCVLYARPYYDSFSIHGGVVLEGKLENLTYISPDEYGYEFVNMADFLKEDKATLEVRKYEIAENIQGWKDVPQDIKDEDVPSFHYPEGPEEHATVALNIEQPKRNKYMREIKPGVWVDVYDVIRAFVVTDGALQHLLKKALCPGKRHHKDKLTDLKDIVASANRALEMHKEWDDNATE